MVAGKLHIRFTAVDGTPFIDGEGVPEGKYLLITDIVVTTDGGTDAEAVFSVDLASLAGTVARQTLRLRSTDNATPYFVLRGGERLRVGNAWFSTEWVYVNVSGILVSNVNYVPLTLND